MAERKLVELLVMGAKMNDLHAESVRDAKELIRRKRTKKHAPRVSAPVEPVQTSKVCEEVWTVAMELANGDRTRIKVESSTSVLVVN